VIVGVLHHPPTYFTRVILQKVAIRSQQVLSRMAGSSGASLSLCVLLTLSYCTDQLNPPCAYFKRRSCAMAQLSKVPVLWYSRDMSYKVELSQITSYL
jgi:hypothetical protein